ncbi:hypothetical protein SCRES3_gp92 [Synechococcus phage S-CRES3]|nr:hypothetical protein SCRES3_gp92 [Synechococcus phage S-CRES3]
MSWWSNWGSSSSEAQQAAASNFLATGNIGTPIGGTQCRGSAECASGYACSGGRCVPINGQTSSDGTLSGCGGEGGGPCDSLTGNNVGVKASGDSGFVYGDVVKTVNGVSTGYQWEPVYAADGCTIAGCKLGACGTENASDCPGGRYCRYDQNGNVNCSCGEPPARTCTVFCDSYQASFGDSAAGCSDKGCDECTTCDGNYFSSTYNTCTPINGSTPCQCEPEKIPACFACNENGTLVPDDSNCSQCFTTSLDCGCGVTIERTCCYPLEELKNGLDGYSRCRDEIGVRCEEECSSPDRPAYVDPCEGDCTPQTQSGSGTCPDSPDGLEDGHRATVTGCIEAGGNYTLLYNDCDMANVPEECGFCDCNCDNDCPSCQLCGADGTCYPDPSCPTCDGQYCPGVGGDCCPAGEQCYSQPAGAGNACCPAGNSLIAVYDNEVATSGSGTTSYRTYGPINIAGSDTCISCTGGSATCGETGARPTFRVTNLVNYGSACDGGGSSGPQAFQDLVAASDCNVSGSWDPIAFPYVVSSTLVGYACEAC